MERQRECDFCEEDAEFQKDGKDYCENHAVAELDMIDLLEKAKFKQIE